MKFLKRILTSLAARGHLVGLYLRVCQPDGIGWARILKEQGHLQSMGNHCSIQTNVTFTDPTFVQLGHNVRLSGCIIFGHDGSVNMINRAYGKNLDRVGPVRIEDNVFIGHGAIVLPGVHIGPNVIVGAGAVVTRDIPANSVAVGSPAKPVCSLDDYVARLEKENATLAWRELLDLRASGQDPELESRIHDVRMTAFFGVQPA